MIATEAWMGMDKEVLADLDEDFSEGSMREISVIFFHHFLVVVWVVEVAGLGLEPMWVKISR